MKKMNSMKHLVLGVIVILLAAAPSSNPQKIAQDNNAFAFDLSKK
jgi:outer membrane biogenesis lipoprotein LolB